MNIPQSIPTII